MRKSFVLSTASKKDVTRKNVFRAFYLAALRFEGLVMQLRRRNLHFTTDLLAMMDRLVTLGCDHFVSQTRQCGNVTLDREQISW